MTHKRKLELIPGVKLTPIDVAMNNWRKKFFDELALKLDREIMKDYESCQGYEAEV